MEILAQLGVDWGTLVAQLINITILIVVLSYFVYRPILNLLDDRRSKIAKSMEDVGRVEQQVQEMEKTRTEQLRKIDAEAGKFLEAAKKQAEAAKTKILGDAEAQVQKMLQTGRKQLESERSKLMTDVQSMLGRISVQMAEKVLQREFSKDDQDRIVRSLEKDIPALLS